MMDLTYLDFVKIAIAFVLGAILGIEREYRSKPAGFRTMIMITVGACMFTILSYRINSTTPDRIAANIITGIGFIGAGVIFKEGLKVSGLTTAATIWISSAIGMATGYGAFHMAAIVTLVVLGTLMLLSKLEDYLERLHQVKLYQVSFLIEEYSSADLEKIFTGYDIKFLKYKEIKLNNQVTAFYKVEARQSVHEALNKFLVETKAIKGFEV